ncbi:MAG: DUF4270 family protein [Chitinophagaceae bacterium]
MKKIFIAVFSLFFILIFDQSCQKIDTTDLGANLIPTVDNINTFDTVLDVITDNIYLPDSSSITRTDNHALGYLEDPEFGNTNAAIYFDVQPANSAVYPFGNKDSASIVDSVVLSLSYTKLYGDSNSIERVRVMEISPSAVFQDTLYKISAAPFPVLPTPLGEQTVDFTTLNDPQVIRKGKDTTLVTEQNILRLKLNNSLGQRLARYDTTNAYRNDSAFNTYFKGFALMIDSVASPRKKSIAYFVLSDNAKTRLTVYYRKFNAGVIDTTYAEFVYKNLVAKGANLVKRNNSNTNYQRNIAAVSNNKDKIYIQSSPGSFATISVPGLHGVSNRLIHRAELIMDVLPSQEQGLLPPPTLFLDMIDSVNKVFKTVPIDFSTDLTGTYNVAVFGGVMLNNHYNFDLTRQIQGIVTQKNVIYTYRLYAPYSTFPIYFPYTIPTGSPIFVNSTIASGRVVLGGGSHPTNKMKLRIIYSKI